MLRRAGEVTGSFGSAPTIAGQGIANPMAMIWAGAMLLEHLGETEAARLVMTALRAVARSGSRTADIGGVATTQGVGAAVAAAIGVPSPTTNQPEAQA